MILKDSYAQKANFENYVLGCVSNGRYCLLNLDKEHPDNAKFILEVNILIYIQVIFAFYFQSYKKALSQSFLMNIFLGDCKAVMH